MSEPWVESSVTVPAKSETQASLGRLRAVDAKGVEARVLSRTRGQNKNGQDLQQASTA
jgi:hypothetical protein